MQVIVEEEDESESEDDLIYDYCDSDEENDEASDSSDGEEALPILRSSRARKIIPNRKFIQ